MNLNNRLKHLETAQRMGAGYTVICTGAGDFGPVSWAEVGGQRIERLAGEPKADFLDRAAALGEPLSARVHIHNVFPSVVIPEVAATMEDWAVQAKDCRTD